MKKFISIFLLLIIFVFEIQAQLTYIPDDYFLAALIDLGYGDGVEGNYIPTSNINYIHYLDVSSRSIGDLTGIEDFEELMELNCSNNHLTSLDVSANQSLLYLHCYDNQLTSLNISSNAILVDLFCNNNQLTNIDISSNTDLVSFICNNNQLTSINVSSNTDLVIIGCEYNQLSNLDVSSNTVLTDLFCNNNQLTSLDVSSNTALKHLVCHENQLSSIDVSANSFLQEFICSFNQCTSINVRNGNNIGISYFDATYNPDLKCIYVDDKSADCLSSWIMDETAYFVNDELECDALNVNDLINSSFEVSPNPTNGIFKLNYSDQNVHVIRITDLSGKVVFEKEVNSPTQVFDISGFTNGLYILILQIDEYKIPVKIIKE